MSSVPPPANNASAVPSFAVDPQLMDVSSAALPQALPQPASAPDQIHYPPEATPANAHPAAVPQERQAGANEETTNQPAAKRTRKAHAPLGQGNVQTWNVADPQVAPPTNALVQVGHKRKLEDEAATDENQHKIRRIVREVVNQQQNADRSIPMTTVICLHAAVAQKSYGSEKRFLCPPPLVRVEGPTWNMREQLLGMSIVSETGERSPEQKAALDPTMTASFKFLHVSGTAKAKSFLLSLDIGGSNVPGLTPEQDPRAPRVWASFDSAPVTIISKPSKKTAKTRNLTSCILAGGPVSLFNRINSQTVRTKYMTIEQTQLCASNTTWSAFNVSLVRNDESLPPSNQQPINYGNEIHLTDHTTGIVAGPLFIRKVDKGKICEDGGPVSQMQKVALQRLNADGSRHYLSAAGPTSTGQVVAPVPGGQHQPSQTHPLLFSSARVRDEMIDGKRVMQDEVDDYLCWTIVGISKFQYTFFDASGRGSTVPEMPITPFPTLFTSPLYRPANQQLELTVANFFYEDPKTGGQLPLEVWLGNLGPLQQRIFPTAATGPLTSVNPMGRTTLSQSIDGFLQGSSTGPNGQPMASLGMMNAGGVSAGGSAHFAPHPPMHTIVVVDVPPIMDIIKSLIEGDPELLAASGVGDGKAENGTADGGSANGGGGGGTPKLTPALMAHLGQSLIPIIFIRTLDGIGYHSGKSVMLDNVFAGMDHQHHPHHPQHPHAQHPHQQQQRHPGAPGQGMGPGPGQGVPGPSGQPGGGPPDQEWVAAAQAAVGDQLAGLTLRVI